LQDSNHRVINYLRLSITDRCNLRCIYCMPEEGISFIPHSEILSYEEMLHLVRLCVQNGIRKVRLTGGEPLVRKGILHFIEGLSRIEGLEEIALTTNGIFLKDFASDLRNCGLCRINVSMDTLIPDRFFHITRRDLFHQVWEGIEEAESVGFNPIKINVVGIKGVNDDEILDFAHLTFERPFHVRFIELMPIGKENSWSSRNFISIEEVLNLVQTLGKVSSVSPDPLGGPSRRYVLEGAKGEIGLIGALSNHFCDHCNRLRLTADGSLKGCLFSDSEVDVKTPLRQGKGDRHLSDLIRNAILNKPKDHGLSDNKPRKCVRTMNSIGG
jgi:cyclic pyranopterin phosphate synthase